MKFKTMYDDVPTVCTKLDLETINVDITELKRCSLAYKLEAFGMDSLKAQLEKTKSQFGFADTRLSKSFGDLLESYKDAREYFDNLPSKVRQQFNHSPAVFYDSLQKNPELGERFGLVSRDYLEKVIQNQSSVDKPVDEKTVQPVEQTSVVESSVTDSASDVNC